MKTAEWKRLIRPGFDERWGVKGKLAYVRPGEGHVLRGVLVEGSAYPGFYVWQFRLPLYGPPHDHLALNWSERLGNGRRYEASDSETSDVVTEAMEQTLVEDAAGETVIVSPDGEENTDTLELKGYGLLLNGDIRRALAAVVCLLFRRNLKRSFNKRLESRIVRLLRIIELA